MTEAEVLTRLEGGLGRLTLNRPKAMNALTLGMVRAIDAALSVWEKDARVGVVLIDGAGERGLCAGGDIRMFYEARIAGSIEPAIAFWREEYRLNARLKRYPKPIVALMAGTVMGGGIGISAHARHRIVTETTVASMPEVSIGFAPDVGGTYLLSRAPGELGTYMALTAARAGPADAILLGLADLHIPSSRIAAMRNALRQISAEQVEATLRSHATEPSAGKLASDRDWIDTCYEGNDVEEILKALEARSVPGATAAATEMRRNAPTSLKVTLRALREARRLGNLEACLAMELRFAAACLSAPDMREGIRAAVIDKDRNPRWSPARLADVTPEALNRYFEHLGPWELVFGQYEKLA